jgi:hypothetical protein
MRILFMLPIFGFFEEFSAFLDVEVSVLKISIFFPAENNDNRSRMRRRTETIYTPSTDL